MSRVQRLVYSIIQFLGNELQSGNLTSDAAESLEVAIQCLESAYGINRDDGSNELQVSMPLLEMFTTVTGQSDAADEKPPTDEDKAEAERLKNEGNDLMKAEKYEEALKCYSSAIQLDRKNAIYYCNRAASYSKLNNHKAAIDDCHTAIDIDPNYSKAYGRMGVAYASLSQFKEAKESYEKAVELDPGNESHINNLKIADERLRESTAGSQGASAWEAGSAGLPFGGGGMDFSSLLGNPALMNMATQVMADPNMQQMMGTLLSGTMGPGQTTGGGGGGGAGGPGIDALLQAGQQLAQQMQASNPDLVDQLRRQMNQNNPGGSDAT